MSNSTLSEGVEHGLERQAIEYLRREYAIATDLIGMGASEEQERGRDIYRRIFTENASIRVVSSGHVTHEGVGPDDWFRTVAQALQPYAGVQHLIGTQVVEFANDDANGCVEAMMDSYLQAWHDCPGEHVFIFIGTYRDRVRFIPGTGWRIHDMELQEVSNAKWSH